MDLNQKIDQEYYSISFSQIMIYDSILIIKLHTSNVKFVQVLYHNHDLFSREKKIMIYLGKKKKQEEGSHESK